MGLTKKINLGEYMILVTYDKVTGGLEIVVNDELGDIIETLIIINSESEDEDFNPMLN